VFCGQSRASASCVSSAATGAQLKSTRRLAASFLLLIFSASSSFFLSCLFLNTIRNCQSLLLRHSVTNFGLEILREGFVGGGFFKGHRIVGLVVFEQL